MKETQHKLNMYLVYIWRNASLLGYLLFALCIWRWPWRQSVSRAALSCQGFWRRLWRHLKWKWLRIFCAVCTQSRFLSCRVGWWGRLLGWLLIWSQGWFPSSPRPRAMWRNKSFQSVSQTFSSDSKVSLFPLTPSKNRFDSSSTHCKSSGSETITLLSEKTGQTDLHIEVHETNKDC